MVTRCGYFRCQDGLGRLYSRLRRLLPWLTKAGSPTKTGPPEPHRGVAPA
jgi:hypothetical protein